MPEIKSDSPSEHGSQMASTVPPRSHARMASTNAPIAPSMMKRPGIAPLLTGTDDTSRSRSETVTSSASVRQRRQGFVQRKATGDLNKVSEVRDEDLRQRHKEDDGEKAEEIDKKIQINLRNSPDQLPRTARAQRWSCTRTKLLGS